MNRYFSDREMGEAPRSNEDFSESAWRGLAALITTLADRGSFGMDYPERCLDQGATIGTNREAFGHAIAGEIPGMAWPLPTYEKPATLAILDLLEFGFDHVAMEKQVDYHPFPRHHHLSFDREAGQEAYREQVNRILGRNQLAFHLTEDGQIERLAPPGLKELMSSQYFRTGDSDLDRTLEAARIKFLSADLEVRKDALKDLWDAWERLKTIVDPKDKKRSVTELLDRAAPSGAFRALLEKEAKELTDIGNQFRIRHSEVNKAPLEFPAQVDLLFHRMFALIWALLKVL